MKTEFDRHRAAEDLRIVLAQSSQLVDEIIEEIGYLAEEFRQGFSASLSLQFDDCLSAIQSLMATMMGLQRIAQQDQIAAQKWQQHYPLWAATEPLFKSALNAMLKAYGHEDYVGLADVMEEELVESLQSWRKFVEKLA